MRRREAITLLGGAAAAWPLGARAQQAAMPVIGWLGSETSADKDSSRFAGYYLGLNDAGYVEGQNVAIEYRWADGQYDRLPELAADLVRRRVTVIVTPASNLAALAAKAATSTIPIVFNIGFDPVKLGLVASLARPGGNVTGVSNLAVELGAKRMELLHELVPNANLIAVLINPSNLNSRSVTEEAQAAARALGLQTHVLGASSEQDFDAAFTTFAQRGDGALVIAPDPLFNSHPSQLVALAARHALPAIYSVHNFAEAGGLMTYSPAFLDSGRLAGGYVARILKGARPAELPVIQPTKFELVVNLKTAKALGLTIPESFLLRADEVIE
jgi:putative ABC transport system substrate-binding protein